ncbi:MAG: hypothetical protein ACI9W2_000360 [Gammaproteobacteria bacterium]|jgi:hypothetical protein
MTRHRDVPLHLRSAGLNASDAALIANALRSLTDADASSLSSLSLSYNQDIGDLGAIRLARGLPRSLPELGLVDCKISDAGAAALLEWAGQSTRPRMLCIEGNDFSHKVAARFRTLAQTPVNLSVYV